MGVDRVRMICLMAVFVWLCAAIPVRAQLQMQPPEEEASVGSMWQEQSIDDRLQQADDDVLDLPSISIAPPRSAGGMEMGGMFAVLKVRDRLPSGYDDPGWYEHPRGTQAYRVSAAESPAATSEKGEEMNHAEHGQHSPGE